MKLSSMIPILLVASAAHAGSVELQGTQSSAIKSQEISADGAYNPKDKSKKGEEVQFNWDASYTHSTMQSPDPTTGINIIDTTHDLVFGSGVETPGHVTLNIDLNYSTTPDENLKDSGPTLTAEYQYFFGEETTNDDSDSFRPSLTGKVGYGYLNYDQSFSTSKPARRKTAPPKPVFGNNTIGQRSVILGLKYKASSWITFKETYTKYQYSRDVAQFLQYIDLPALAKVSSGIDSALSGFYTYTSKFEILLYFLKDWELDYANSQSRVAADLSFTTENDLILSYDINDDWTVGGGIEDVTSTSPTTPPDNSVVAKLTYYF